MAKAIDGVALLLLLLGFTVLVQLSAALYSLTSALEMPITSGRSTGLKAELLNGIAACSGKIIELKFCIQSYLPLTT